MKKNNNTISFIIVNYKSARELNACLSDLSKIKNSSTFKIIIVNNDSKRLSLRQNDFASQQIIEINKNIGYGSACNKGLEFVNTDFVCFLNPDTHSFCNNLSDITTFIRDAKTIVSPKILTNTNTVEPWSVGKKITLTQTIKNSVGLYKKTWLAQNETRADWVSGAAMFVPTQFIKDLNGFDESFFLYFEDVDLCQRVYNCGGAVKYIPQFYLTHINGVSSKKASKKQKKCYYNSQDLFFKKHLGTTRMNLMRLCRFFYTK